MNDIPLALEVWAVRSHNIMDGNESRSRNRRLRVITRSALEKDILADPTVHSGWATGVLSYVRRRGHTVGRLTPIQL
jgi:hypothetical protein